MSFFFFFLLRLLKLWKFNAWILCMWTFMHANRFYSLFIWNCIESVPYYILWWDLFSHNHFFSLHSQIYLRWNYMVLWARISYTHHIIVTRAVASNNNLFFFKLNSLKWQKFQIKKRFFFISVKTIFSKQKKWIEHVIID